MHPKRTSIVSHVATLTDENHQFFSSHTATFIVFQTSLFCNIVGSNSGEVGRSHRSETRSSRLQESYSAKKMHGERVTISTI